jgi:hypothetical protein
MSQVLKDKDGRLILFENDTIRITKLLCPMPTEQAYQFMMWEKKSGDWFYKQTVTDWHPYE